MFNKLFTLKVLISSALLLTACNSDKAIDTLTNSEDSEQERISKKDVVYIIKYTPESVCKSASFKEAIESTIKSSSIKIVNIKDLSTSVQTNDVTCNTFKPSDITDLIDPICKELKATEIDENYEIPENVELNDLVATSCVVSGDIF